MKITIESDLDQVNPNLPLSLEVPKNTTVREAAQLIEQLVNVFCSEFVLFDKDSELYLQCEESRLQSQNLVLKSRIEHVKRLEAAERESRDNYPTIKKPVILLYPSSELEYQNLLVTTKLSLDDGSKLTSLYPEPEAHSRTKAMWTTRIDFKTPETLLNITDGTAVPYLFWESEHLSDDCSSLAFLDHPDAFCVTSE